MKILIFGGSGRTGQVMVRAAKQAGHTVLAPSHAECDLAQSEAVSDWVLGCGAEAVVNAAAISGLEACMDDALTAHLVNAVAPASMALACRHTGARFVQLSTDYVLDGRKEGKKTEQAKCKPINTYGESKREGELQVMEALPEAIVARVSWICGNPERPSFIESTVAKALAGQPLAAIADKYSLPTDAEDIARTILQLLTNPLHADVTGILHVCSSGTPQSWYSCARIALQRAVERGALASLPEVAMQSLAGADFFRAERPRHTAMDNSAKLLVRGIRMPRSEECIRQVTDRFLDTMQPS